MNLKTNEENSKIENDEISKLIDITEEKNLSSLKNYNVNDSSKENLKNNNNNSTCNTKINYGKYKILLYDHNNEPLLVLGPDYLYFLLVIILDLILVIFLTIVHYCYATLIIRIFGLLLSMFQICVYIYCSLKNPGFPKRAIQDESLLNQKDGYYRRCKECGIIVDLRKYPGHCYVCKFCCEGFDHHCSFTTKCIGSGNAKEFKTFLGSFFILICYFAISALWFDPSSNKCRFNFF